MGMGGAAAGKRGDNQRECVHTMVWFLTRVCCFDFSSLFPRTLIVQLINYFGENYKQFDFGNEKLLEQWAKHDEYR